MSPDNYWLALQEFFFANPLRAQEFMAAYGSPEKIFEAIPSLGRELDWKRVEGSASFCRSNNVKIVRQVDACYPPLLSECKDRPPILFCDGMVETLSTRPVVGIVGSRKASAYGIAIAEKIACGLARAGVTVASGLAYGVDVAAHRGALAGGGWTVGVLGGGLGHFYPATHRSLAEKMKKSGAVITEFPPDVSPLPPYFPQRNRIISGMSFAVVIVEAAEKSGSLITARHALEQDRLVFAVPGAVGNVNTKGTNNLLRQGAHIAEGAEDILEGIRPMIAECGMQNVECGMKNPQSAIATPQSTCGPQPDDAMGRVLMPRLSEPCVLDQLVEASGASVGDVLSWLTKMECDGRIRSLPGNRYVVA